MTLTETGVHRRQVLAAMAVPLAGCSGQVPGADTEGTRTDAGTPTDTAQSEPGGWSVRFAYDGDWQGTVSVTTAEGDSHQAFDGQGAKIVDIETQLGVETQAVEDIVVTAQKRVNDNRSLQVAIRKDGDIVAEGSTAQPRGQVMVSHHEEADADTEGTRTDTETSMDTPPPEPGGWSVHFAYDGNWQGTVTVTTAEGDSHQAFDGQGAKIVDIETQLGVETRAVEEIVVTAQKQASDDQTLQVAIRKDGDIVAEGSTAQPRGQVMVSHHV